ncbi:hypothetical protein WG66_003983 [Moniliophthora roreri]|nr:hypothetical protein WG66_003983 [Moniliophthora roreri]
MGLGDHIRFGGGCSQGSILTKARLVAIIHALSPSTILATTHNQASVATLIQRSSNNGERSLGVCESTGHFGLMPQRLGTASRQ